MSEQEQQKPQSPARKKLQFVLAMVSLTLRNVGLVGLSAVIFSKANILSFETVILSLLPLLFMQNPMKYCGCSGSGGCKGCQEKTMQAVGVQ
jgi:hypothetical protein